MKQFEFREAKPVWAKEKEREMNFSLIMRAVVARGEKTLLDITGHSDYQICINGCFFAHGPARAGHGSFRVDRLDISGRLTEERNVVAVVCAGYNVNTFYLTKQPPFVCAEIVSGGEVLFATGTEKSFDFYDYPERVQKVQRYSFQRPFAEYYRLRADYDRVLKDAVFSAEKLPVEKTEAKRFIARGTLRSDYEERNAVSVIARGTAKERENRETYHNWILDNAGSETFGGFRLDELEVRSVEEIVSHEFTITDKSSVPFSGCFLPENGFALFDMGLNTSGYIRIKVRPEKNTVLWAVFNETLYEELPVADHDTCEIGWELDGGKEYDLVSFEPYTYRFIKLFSKGSPARVKVVSQIAEHYPACGLRHLLKLDDEELQKIYDAAVETFRQNATDIFMDCPSRERAGWLCDSFFTSRSERTLTGESRVEKDFLENFVISTGFPNIAEGMLPMCYPSDHYDENYIPNWAMWYLIELAEYFEITGDRELVDSAKQRIMKLAAFLERYENKKGLLEKLERWVFVEWSKANDFVQDVNYPTNMLYSLFLEKIGELYGEEIFIEKAKKLKAVIREESFDGEFFVDNSVFEGSELKLTRNRTETCQYYAFFTGVATKESYPELYEKMKDKFGPKRDPEKEYPEIHVSNAFIGNYLRLEVFFREGENKQVLDEIRAFFLPMAERTGTLWEHMNPGASCCHGFASHIVYWMNSIFEKTDIKHITGREQWISNAN